MIDPTVTRPREPAVPECSHLGRLGDTDRKKIRLNEQKRAARSDACDQIPDCRFYIIDMVKHSARSYQVECSALHRTGQDVALAQLEIRRAHFDYQHIEVERHYYSI